MSTLLSLPGKVSSLVGQPDAPVATRTEMHTNYHGRKEDLEQERSKTLRAWCR